MLTTLFFIFICTFDPFSAGLPCYTFKNICLENKNLELKDTETKINNKLMSISKKSDKAKPPWFKLYRFFLLSLEILNPKF